jgi:hypothetical protein
LYPSMFSSRVGFLDRIAPYLLDSACTIAAIRALFLGGHLPSNEIKLQFDLHCFQIPFFGNSHFKLRAHTISTVEFKVRVQSDLPVFLFEPWSCSPCHFTSAQSDTTLAPTVVACFGDKEATETPLWPKFPRR